MRAEEELERILAMAAGKTASVSTAGIIQSGGQQEKGRFASKQRRTFSVDELQRECDWPHTNGPSFINAQ